MAATQTHDPLAATRLAALMQPAAARLRWAALLSVAASMLWLPQAALVAAALAGLLHQMTGAAPGRLAATPVAAASVAFGFLAIAIMRALLAMAADALAERATEAVIHDIRARILQAEASRSGFGRSGGAAAVAALAGPKLQLLQPYGQRYASAKARVMLLPAVILLIAFWQSWAVALVFLITGPLIPLFMLLIGSSAQNANHKHLASMANLNELLIERLWALADIRLLGAAPRVAAAVMARGQQLRHRMMKVLAVAFLSSAVLELLAALGIAMVAVWVGFSLLGALSFGTWGPPLQPEVGIFLLLLAPEFYQPLRDLAAAWHDRAAALALAEALALWQAEQEIAAPLLGQGGVAGGRPCPWPAAPSLQLLGCRAPAGKPLPDLHIAPGERVALVGPSGAGKTTALRLLAGLIGAEQGQVRVAGQLLAAENADGWRAGLGWMPQRPHFLQASLRANISLGRAAPAPLTTEEAIAAAIAAAAAGPVLAALPQGLHSVLGENGGGMSGGEARRMTLARALYGQPAVLLADEPTADLDATTAALVTESLLAAADRGATLVVATHDPKLAARMDRVILFGVPA